MELREALRTRKSIRAFKSEAVPQSLVTRVLEAARWAPSWGNTQPWELVVVGGDTVKRLGAAMAEAYEKNVTPNPEVPMPLPMPEKFPEFYLKRIHTTAAGLFKVMGIAREDKASRQAHMVKMTRAFDAPVIIYVIFDAGLTIPYAMLDMGAITYSLCLAAHAHGLGTCILAQVAFYPDLIRQHMEIPSTHKIAVGIALGYPDPEAPANAFRTDREPLEKFVHWVDW